MTDFAAVIDRAIASDTRAKLGAFLTGFEHLEFGQPRKLDAAEVALVLTATDRFLVEDRLFSLDLPEVRRLTEQLSAIADQDLTASAETRRIKNMCFDALACIKALEAQLSLARYRASVLVQTAAAAHWANDP
jgi:hypothetical protein